jgi:hypothetical protein
MESEKLFPPLERLAVPFAVLKIKKTTQIAAVEIKIMKRILIIVSVCMSKLTLFAQTSVNVAGGEATGSNGQMSFSVGEIVYTTMSNGNNIITQGAQQPYSNDLSSNFDLTATNTTICTGQTTTLTVNFGPTYPQGTVHCSGAPTAVVDVTNPTTGKTWMDRNLGASQVATSSTDAAAYGDLYQWGRGADGHQCRNSGTTTTLSSTDQPGNSNFILAPNAPYDWRSPQNTNLWQGVNGINNPCPIGYRIPTNTELNIERLSWVQAPINSTNSSDGAISSPLKLPNPGYRRLNDGVVVGIGTNGYYWASSIETLDPDLDSAAIYLDIGIFESVMSNNWRSFGISIRCIKN